MAASDREKIQEKYPDYFEDEDCYECGGEGFVVADCFEDSCCCEDPELQHGLIPCPVCQPKRKAVKP